VLLISSKLTQTSFDFQFDENFTQNLNSEVYYALQCFKQSNEQKAIEELFLITFSEEDILSQSQKRLMNLSTKLVLFTLSQT